VLGCIASECPERHWKQILCPSCNHALDDRTDLRSDMDLVLAQEEPTMWNGDRFTRLNQAMQDYHRMLARAQGATPDGSLRDLLGSLQTAMKDSTEKLVESLNRLEEQDQQRARRLEMQKAEAAIKLEEAKKVRQEALAVLAAKKAARAARPPRQGEVVDLHLGARLRDTHLEEFGIRVETLPSGRPGSRGLPLDFDPGA
jgi:hypothetical protein